MAKLLKNASLFVLTQKCADKYFDDFDFLDGDCFKASLSKGLGFGIILGSVLVKVPQILKILSSKSVQGINILSVLLDLFAATVLSAYGFLNDFPFSSWGDAVFLALQTLVIALLVLYDFKNTTKAGAFLFAYLAVIVSIVQKITPMNVVMACQAVNIPVVLAAKLTQAWTNYANGSTGQLSAITCFMLFFGSMARIFTSVQETGDASMVIMSAGATAANAVLVFQVLYYWNVGNKKQKRNKKNK